MQNSQFLTSPPLMTANGQLSGRHHPCKPFCWRKLGCHPDVILLNQLKASFWWYSHFETEGKLMAARPTRHSCNNGKFWWSANLKQQPSCNYWEETGT